MKPFGYLNLSWQLKLAAENFNVVLSLLGGVYMRKLAPARVSYRDEFFISYHIYIMTGSFHISLFEGTLHVDKIHVIQNRKHYACTTRSSLPAFHTETGLTFRVYMIPLQDFVPE